MDENEQETDNSVLAKVPTQLFRLRCISNDGTFGALICGHTPCFCVIKHVAADEA